MSRVQNRRKMTVRWRSANLEVRCLRWSGFGGSQNAKTNEDGRYGSSTSKSLRWRRKMAKQPSNILICVCLLSLEMSYMPVYETFFCNAICCRLSELIVGPRFVKVPKACVRRRIKCMWAKVHCFLCKKLHKAVCYWGWLVSYCA